MGHQSPDAQNASRLERVLGYLNFSSGAEDPVILRELNEICRSIERPSPTCRKDDLAVEQPTWLRLRELLERHLEVASRTSPALSDSRQARAVLTLTFDHVLPDYLRHHRDLLFHQTGATMFNAFFIGRVFEVVLRNLEHRDDQDDLAKRAIGLLNDFIGHRPVAVLETRKLEPYEHEWVRPLPIYIRGAGVAHGPWFEVVQSAIDHLQKTDPEILHLAGFEPELLDELAIDPRAFDFDHPANKRPNHHFGQWDEHHIDNQGRYRRYIVHGVTIRALCDRVNEESELPREELVFEAGAALACTILMSAGICGYGPGAHDSTVTLGSLLPTIAAYRDQFYDDLLARTPHPHRERLLVEARIRQQPFGAARQHLNQQLASYRAIQMMHVHLALVFARMGYPDAAMRHADALPVASARIFCRLECLLYAGSCALQDGKLAEACRSIPQVFDLLRRGIDCGAVFDPWNILGLDATYNLFQGTENTIHDYRADELIDFLDQLFGFVSAVWIAAEAGNQPEIASRVQGDFRGLVDWWHQFAAHEVSSVDAFDAREVFSATENVARLMGQRHTAPGASEGRGFWARRASEFNSDRDYVLAIANLIERDEFEPSMALLIHWLGQQEELMAARQDTVSFHGLTVSWIGRQRELLLEQDSPEAWTAMAGDVWNRLCKFSDYVEANAGPWWNIPRFALTSAEGGVSDPYAEPGEADDDDGSDLFRAAYEGMVFRETADDGFEGSVFDDDQSSEEELQSELDRILEHLKFHDAIISCWFEAALLAGDIYRRSDDEGEEAATFLRRTRVKVDEWTQQSARNRDDLVDLVRSIQQFRLPAADGSVDSLVEYDRQRLFKETLLDHVIHLSVDMAVTWHNLGAVGRSLSGKTTAATSRDDEARRESRLWVETISALLAGDRRRTRNWLKKLIEFLADQPLLYVPLSRGGDPMKITSVRVRQALIGQMLDCLPRIGLFAETRELIHTALTMERSQSVRHGAVTEFDELFRVGYTSMVDALIHACDAVEAARDPAEAKKKFDSRGNPDLFESLESLAESMLMVWLDHSHTLRLSVLEKVRETPAWNALVDFIERFGDPIFTQNFLNLSNIRAILHQGVDQWLTQLEEEAGDEESWQILEQIRAGYPRREAVRHLTFVLEAVIENFAEYRDYNSTTTQSDNGRLIYILLDFLRLRSRYDQICWNLKPVMWAHEALVRKDHGRVARLWRRLLAARVNPEAEKLLEQLVELQELYSIRMATVAQRLGERFVHPMHVDRLVSLVGPAMDDPASEESRRQFELIEHYAGTLARLPAGAGLDLPAWIIALESEVDAQMASMHYVVSGDPLIEYDLPDIRDLRRQIDKLPRREF